MKRMLENVEAEEASLASIMDSCMELKDKMASAKSVSARAKLQEEFDEAAEQANRARHTIELFRKGIKFLGAPTTQEAVCDTKPYMLLKMPTNMPEFKSGNNVEHFLLLFTQCVMANDVDCSHYVKCFLNCMRGDDVVRFIQDKIKNNISYDMLVKLFTEKFQTFSQRLEGYRYFFSPQSQQRNNESVQQYADRFLSMVSNLQIVTQGSEIETFELNSKVVIGHFIFGLCQSSLFFKQLHEQRAMKGSEDPRNPYVSTLKEAIAMAEVLETLHSSLLMQLLKEQV